MSDLLKRTRSKEAETTAVAASTDAVTLLEADNNREGYYILNDSAETMYIKFGPDASTSDYGLKLGPGQIYETPALTYVGEVTAVWSAADGNARVTDLKG